MNDVINLKTQFKRFICDNKWLIIGMAIITVIINWINITCYRVGIDTEYAIGRTLSATISGWIAQGRFGISFLKLIFSKSIEVTTIANFISVLVLVCTMIVFLLIIETADRDYAKKNKKLLFIVSMLFISFPSIAYYMYFAMYSVEISVGYLCVMLSCLLLAERECVKKRNILFGILLITFAISIYQSFITLYIGVVCLYLFISMYNHQCGWKKIVVTTLKYVMYLMVALVIYFIVNKILTCIFGSSGYLDSFFGWRQMSEQQLTSMGYSIFGCFNGEVLYGGEHLLFFYVLIVVFAVLLLFLGKGENKLFVCHIMMLLVSPFALILVLGAYQPIRAIVCLPLLIPAIVLIIVRMLGDKIRRALYVIICCLCVWLVYSQSVDLNKLYISDYTRYQEDVMLVEQINMRVNAARVSEDAEVPLVIVGAHASSDANPMIIRTEAIGASFFEWDGGNISRINKFMRLLGYDYTMPSDEQIKLGYDISKDMPVWPAQGSVKEEEGVIVVKLSNHIERWKLLYGIE